jgi:hypothetical protein
VVRPPQVVVLGHCLGGSICLSNNKPALDEMTALLTLPDCFDSDPGPLHQPLELGVLVIAGPVLVALGPTLLLQLAHAEDESYVFLGDQSPETLNRVLQRSLCRDDLSVILSEAAVNEIGVNIVVHFGIPAIPHR